MADRRRPPAEGRAGLERDEAEAPAAEERVDQIRERSAPPPLSRIQLEELRRRLRQKFH